MSRSSSKLLVANRGEIACRIMRTARALGFRTVAVCSEADRDALHARAADETVLIGPAPAVESYLSIDALIAAARRTGADAIHPGYGFLSENAAFARACAEAGITFVGPPAAAITAMGDKAAAKRLMLRARVPCIPGYQGEAQDDAVLLREAERIGLPLMVKAAAGGGGKGMRLVRTADALRPALSAARSEAKSAFGCDTLILERAIENARHIEIQIFGDTHGNLIHLHERDCSVQRRHQKVLEESPSPAVEPTLRRRMGESAVAAAKAVDYVGAGTVEFLLDADQNFYFLEMNTRVQVEHPVTECVTGIDLVEWQLRVAAGERLPLAQADVPLHGAAIEARLYAESPASGFLPRTGRIVGWRLPSGAGVRVDHGLHKGAEVTAWYDPMLAKVIAHGTTREDARRRLRRALTDLFVAGVETNRAFLIDCLDAPHFVSGAATTDFIDHTFGVTGIRARHPDEHTQALAALLLTRCAGAWSSTGALERRCKLRCGDATTMVRFVVQRDASVIVRVGEGAPAQFIVVDDTDGEVRYRRDGMERSARYARLGERLHLADGSLDFEFEDVTHAAPAGARTHGGSLALAPMAGKVAAVLVNQGERVTKGQPVAILEAMKMELEISSPRDGVVSAVHAAPNDQVSMRAVLLELADEPA